MMIDTDKKRVALIGAISCNSGIATVVNTIINSEKIKNNYDLLTFNTTNYKDSNFFINLIIFVKSIFIYLKKLLEVKIHIAHIHTSYRRSFYRKIFFIYLSSLFKLKIILHFHTGRFDEFFIDSFGIKKKLIEFSLKKTDAIILLCKDWKSKIEEKYAVKNAYVINNPIPFDLDQIKINAKRSNLNFVKILFFGFMIKTKGIYDIIEVTERLNKKRLDCLIIICGKGEEEKKFGKEIKERNLKNIEYLGWVTGVKKKDLLKESDIFLLPSYYEGMNNALLEAIAYGLPIVSTKVGRTPDMVIDGKNGYLLNPGDIDGIVEKIKILILNPKKRELFGRRSRIIAENFKKGRISEEWHKLYQKLLEKG